MDEKIKELQAFADSVHIPLLIGEPESQDTRELALRFNEKGLALTGMGMELMGDFTHMIPRLKHNNLSHEFLVKAAKIKGIDRTPRAVDATAGLGEDTILLAAAGFDVVMFEYNPVIAALLADALERAAHTADLKEIVSRMHLICGDSIQGMRNLTETPDVIVLDPMFPKRQKSALVKRKFQLLHQLEMPCNDENELLDAAIAAGPKKIVIKRPLKGPFLGGRQPSYSLAGKAIRYDCLVNPAGPA